MKLPRTSAFVLATAGALAGSCSLNPQPFPPIGGSQNTGGTPVGGRNGGDASLAAGDATSDASSGEQSSPTVSRDAGAPFDAPFDAQSEVEVSNDSASDVTSEGGE